MTLHSRVQYQCEYCDTQFVPIPEAPECPKCGGKSDKVFPDFVKDTLESAEFNLYRYGKCMNVWIELNVGDFYYLMAFCFLDYVCTELKADKWHLLERKFPKAQIDLLVSKFLSQRVYKDSQLYWRHGLTTYLSLLLQREPTHRFKWLTSLAR